MAAEPQQPSLCPVHYMLNAECGTWCQRARRALTVINDEVAEYFRQHEMDLEYQRRSWNARQRELEKKR
jgi:hypothetical protein